MYACHTWKRDQVGGKAWARESPENNEEARQQRRISSRKATEADVLGSDLV